MIYIKLINRLTLETFTIDATFQQINLKINAFNFTNVFDLVSEVPLGKRPKIAPHSFIEFYTDINGVPFQLATGYLEDFVTDTAEDKFTMQANGKGLMGQLMNTNFKTTLYSEDMEMGQFVNLAVKNEYLETYNKFKNRPGMIIDQKYNRATFLACSEQNQMKGQILERYAALGCILAFEDRLGRVVLLGTEFPMPEPKGRLIDAKGRSNVTKITLRESYSEVYSDATVFYTQSEALTDANATPSVRYINTDKRVSGVISRPHYESFNVSDIKHFAGNILPEERIKQVAKSKIRKSNRKLGQVVVSDTLPYYVDPITKEAIPYELLQAWEIETDEFFLKTSLSPEGTNLVTMILTGIDYGSGDSSLNVQLLFSEFETLI